MTPSRIRRCRYRLCLPSSPLSHSKAHEVQVTEFKLAYGTRGPRLGQARAWPVPTCARLQCTARLMIFPSHHCLARDKIMRKN
eukprot:766289-Hanusia_phi.AAC.3